MEIKVNSYKKQSTLISSIVFFIIGGILFTNPDIFITTISKIFGIILLIIALFFIYSMFAKNIDDENNNIATKLVSAIFFIALAIVFFFFSETIEKIIRIIVGFWILFSGINRLINALRITNHNKKFFSLIIISLLLILVGIYTIIAGDLLISTLGIILMIYSAIDIIGYIFYAKESDETIEIDPNTILITSNEEPIEDEQPKKKKKRRKNKNIKDAKTTEK